MNNKSSRWSARNLTTIALFTAVIVVVSQLSVPLPGGVPMTLQTFIIPLAGVVLGAFGGTMSTLLYVLLGAIGIPVFAGFTGGLGIVLGMTGGFIVSFPLMALTAGWGDSLGRKVSGKNASGKALYYVILVVMLVVGSALNYVVGTIWFMVAAEASFATAFSACVAPFIPTAILKVVLVAILGPAIRTALIKAHVLVPAGAAT